MYESKICFLGRVTILTIINVTCVTEIDQKKKLKPAIEHNYVKKVFYLADKPEK